MNRKIIAVIDERAINYKTGLRELVVGFFDVVSFELMIEVTKENDYYVPDNELVRALIPRIFPNMVKHFIVQY